MPMYWILSHVKGHSSGSYAQTEIEATDDDDAVQKFNKFIEDRESLQDRIGIVRDRTTLVRVIGRVNK